jgi:HlyD family secretion protein
MSSIAQSSRGRRAFGRIAIILTLTAGGVALATGGLSQRVAWLKKPVPVRVARATVGVVRDVVSSASAGEVTPELQATVRAELGGQVVAVRFEPGARVNKGDLVVQVDPADLDAKLRQAQAALDTAEAQRAQAVSRLETLRRQAQRANLLASRGAGTIQISEDADGAVSEAAQSLQAITSQKAQAQAALAVARVARSHADITAPFAGVLTDVYPHLGESLPPGTPVLQIIDDTRLHVDATVDEADAAKVRPGLPAELHLDALPGRVIAGRVARVDPVVKRDPKGARTLTVEVEVAGVAEARAAGLRPGMSANVEIIAAEKRDVLAVPSNAIVGRGVSRFVYVLVPAGSAYRLRKTAVDIGLSNWERSEILHGVAPGDLLLLSLNDKGVEDGGLVRPLPEKEQEKEHGDGKTGD